MPYLTGCKFKDKLQNLNNHLNLYHLNDNKSFKIEIKLAYPNDKLLYKQMLTKMLNNELNMDKFECDFISSLKIPQTISNVKKMLVKHYKNRIDEMYFKLFIPFETTNDHIMYKKVPKNELKSQIIHKTCKIYYKIIYFPELYVNTFFVTV